MRSRTMKIPVGAALAALLLVVLFTVAACGDDAADEPTTTSDGAVTTQAPATETTVTGTETTAAADAAALYADECASCHGAEGEGGIGAELRGRTDLTEEQAEVTIRQGAGGMPAFEGELTDEQIQALAQYVVEELAQ